MSEEMTEDKTQEDQVCPVCQDPKPTQYQYCDECERFRINVETARKKKRRQEAFGDITEILK